MKFNPAIIATVLVFTLTSACSNANQVTDDSVKLTTKQGTSQTMNQSTVINSQTTQLQLSDDILAGLKLMYEEEKLAFDVYATLYDKWQIQAFSNISSTEARHQQAVKELLDTYAIEVEDNLPVGQFTDSHLQQAYDELVAKGMQSEQDALEVGAYVEELDIKDLNHLLTLESPEDIRQTYEWLNMGSRNHLRAFVRNMSNRNIDYQPTLLDEQVYLDIINGDHEHGMGRGKGHGHGQGNGKNHG